MSNEWFAQVERVMEMLTPTTGDSGDLDANLARILQAAHASFAPDYCAIIAINPITQQCMQRSVRHTDDRIEHQQLHHHLLSDALVQAALAQGQIIVSDLATAPTMATPFTHSHAIRAFCATTLRTVSRQQPLAVLFLDFRQPRTFTDEERDLLDILCNYAVLLLQQMWLLYRYAEVTRIGKAINQHLESVEALFKKLYPLVANILESDHVFMLATYQNQSNTLDLYVVEQGNLIPPILNDRLSGGSRWVLENAQPLVIHHRSEESLDQSIVLEDIPNLANNEESLIFLPLMLRDVPLGVLSIQHTRPNAYDTEDQRILELLGNHVTIALSNIRLFESLRQINETGQIITQQIDTERLLQLVVDQIHARTRADIVVLFPYSQLSGEFDLPRISGRLFASIYTHHISSDHMANMALQHGQPIFARRSTDIFTKLGGQRDQRHGNFEQRESVESVAVVPLQVGQEAVGVLFVNFRQAQRFDAPQKHLIQSLAFHAAIGIANARAFEAQVKRRVGELEALQQIDRALAKSLDLDQTLQTILNLAIIHIPITKASIFLYNPQTRMLETKVVYHRDDPNFAQNLNIPLNEKRGLVWWAFEHRRSVRVRNVLTDRKWRHLYISAADGMLSELDAPLLDGDQAIGVINFESERAEAFSEADEQFLVTLAGQAVLAIKNAQSYLFQQRLAEEALALSTISNEIIEQLDLSQVFSLILNKALALTQSPYGTLMLYQERHGELTMGAEQGVREEQKGHGHAISEGIVGYVARTKTLVNAGDLTQAPWNTMHLSFIPDVRSELAVPMLEGEQLRGVINVESPDLNHFSEHDEKLLTAFAKLAVLAWQTVERHDKAIKRQERLRALHQVTEQIISQVENLDRVMAAILRYGLELSEAETADLHIYEGDTVINTYFAQRNQSKPPVMIASNDPQSTRIQRGIVAYVAATGQPYLTVGDAQADPLYLGEPDSHIHSELAVPLKSDTKRLVGVLNLESSAHNAFDEEDVELLNLLAGQAVIAIQNARTHQRLLLLDQASRKLASIADISQLEQAYEAVVQIVLQMQPRGQITIRRYEPIHDQLDLVYSIPDHPIQPLPSRTRDTSLNWHAMHNLDSLLVPSPDDQAYGKILVEHSPLARSWLGAPLQFDKQIYGSISLTLTEEHSVLEMDRRLFEGLAQQLATTIHRLEVAKRMRETQVMSSIGQSAAELAHRLNNDLGLVRPATNAIWRALETQDMSLIPLQLERISATVGRVLRLSEDLEKRLNSLQDEHLHHQPDEVLVQGLFEEVCALYPLSEQVSVEINVEPKDSVIWADARNIADILRNLFMNALDAMPQGGTIRLHSQRHGNMVEIQVSDTGIGIPPHLQQQIFELFYSTKGSSGFGLWSARQYALANGGDLRVRSVVGSGTTFILLLPQSFQRARSINGDIPE